MIEKILPTQVGKNATFSRYSRVPKNPMNSVLDEAAKQLSKDFVVYWVDEGLPEHFCLHGFSLIPVIYNSRYIELVYLARKLLVSDSLSNFRTELAERISLKVMAEFSLREGNSEWAVLAFLKSVLRQSIQIADIKGFSVMDLEDEPVSEGYMTTWFFALLHELGHFADDDLERLKTGKGLFSNEGIADALNYALNNFPYPPEMKEEALSTARRRPADFVLGLDHLRKEGLADYFAASLLLRTTLDLLSKERAAFRIEQFIFELTVFMNIMSFIEQSKLISRGVSAPSDELVEKILFHPVSYHVRTLMLHEYLQQAAAMYLFNSDNPSKKQRREITQLMEQVSVYIGERILQIEAGVDRAMRFALFPKEREPELFEKVEKQFTQSDQFSNTFEARRFCDLADSFGATGDNVKRLQKALPV